MRETVLLFSSEMTSRSCILDSLPLDLLPSILGHLVKRSDIKNSLLVCREFHRVAEPLLYRTIRLWGRDLAIVGLLLETLAANSTICAHIRRLEVRVFPLSLIMSERRAMEDLAVRVISQCFNLRELLWTRKGALTDR